MRRLRRDILTFSGDGLCYQEKPYSGAVFEVASGVVLQASQIETGRLVSPYRPAYFDLINAVKQIDLSPLLDQTDGCIDLLFEYQGSPFSGVGYAFDENGFCYREVGFDGGAWVFDAEFVYAGPISLVWHDQSGHFKKSWHGNGALKTASVETAGDCAASVSFSEAGRLYSVQLTESALETVANVTPSFAPFPIHEKQELYSLPYATKLWLHGADIDTATLRDMQVQLNASLTREVYLSSTRIGIDALDVFLAMPSLAKLHIESELDSQLTLAKEVRGRRPSAEVSFYRIAQDGSWDSEEV